MDKPGIVADPEELDRLTDAFCEAWQLVGDNPLVAARKHVLREWLALIVLGLRASGHAENLGDLARRQLLETSPTL